LPLQDFLIVALIVAVIGAVSIPAGVAVGVAVAMAIFVLNYSRVRVIRQELSGADYRSNVDRSPAALALLREQGGAIRVIKLEGFIFFGTAYSVLTRIQQMIASPGGRPLRFLILDFRDVPASDSSAMLAFSKIRTCCERNGCQLIITRMNGPIRAQFRQAGIEAADSDTVFAEDLDEAMERCEQRILSEAAEDGLQADVSGLERIRSVLPEGSSLSGFMAYLESRTYAPGEYLLRQGAPAIARRWHHDRRDRAVFEAAAERVRHRRRANARPCAECREAARDGGAGSASRQRAASRHCHTAGGAPDHHQRSSATADRLDTGNHIQFCEGIVQSGRLFRSISSLAARLLEAVTSWYRT
jgi:SulP family sulfate permease